MRILQIIKGLDIGAECGGSELFGLELGRELAKQGQDVQLCCFFRYKTETEKLWQQRLSEEGVKHFFLKDWDRPHHLRNFMQGTRQLMKEMRRDPVDVCHSHFPLGGVAALAIKAARGAKTALRTVHGDREWEKSWYRWTLRPLYINMLFPILLDVEVGVSQAVVDYLAKHPGSRLFQRNPLLIYNAIPIKASLPLKPTLHPKEEGQILLGSVGRLTTQKGYIYLIQAFPRILQEFAGIKCIIAGEGELRTELEAEIHRLGMENFITLLGQRNDICELLNQMDLFVLPSLWEGLPTVALESMAIGTPVLATDVPGTRELIQNEVTGWLVPPQDPDRLALGIIRALKDSALRRRISSDAFAQLEKFSIRAIAMQYISLYSSILRNKPKKGENKGT